MNKRRYRRLGEKGCDRNMQRHTQTVVQDRSMRETKRVSATNDKTKLIFTTRPISHSWHRVLHRKRASE